MNEKRPNVLIVDDEEHIRKLMKVVINSIGYKVVGEANNGEDALNIFKLLKPDILLLDINMPIKTGEEVLEEVIKHFPNTVVIMLTSVSDLESVQNCIKLGSRGYIRKDTPITKIGVIIKNTWQTFLSAKKKR